MGGGLGYDHMKWTSPRHNPITTALRAAERRGITPYPGDFAVTWWFQRFAPLRGRAA